MSLDCPPPPENPSTPPKPGEASPFQHFDRLLAATARSLAACQSADELRALKAQIAELTAQWEAVYIHGGPLSREQLLRLITLREERMRSLLRRLEQRFNPLP